MSTTAPADVREVVLATIRARLLDDDVHTLRYDEDEHDRHTWSIAEHALDAARARGADLPDVFVAVATELERLGHERYDPEHHGLFHPGLDHLADLPFEQIGFEPPVGLIHQECTLSDLRRSQTARLLYLLTLTLADRAFQRVRRTYVARLAEHDLDGTTTAVGQVIGRDERVALFTAGLYGDDEEGLVA
jgi:hypothetical protein